MPHDKISEEHTHNEVKEDERGTAEPVLPTRTPRLPQALEEKEEHREK